MVSKAFNVFQAALERRWKLLLGAMPALVRVTRKKDVPPLPDAGAEYPLK